jgi:CDP-glucose 4,6-dehydratase
MHKKLNIKLLKNFFYNKRVVITGHTGFKGIWLSIILKNFGAKVYGFSLKEQSRVNNLKFFNLEKKIKTYYGDIANKKSFYKFLNQAKPNILFHLAAQPLVKESYINPYKTFETNVMGMLNVLEYTKISKSLKSTVLITSDKCYKNKELLSGYTENSEIGGDDPYSASKAAAENLFYAYNKSFFKKNNIGVATVRAGNVIGGGDWCKDRIIPDAIRSIIKKKKLIVRSPDAVRPWQHVLEPISGYIKLSFYLYNNKKSNFNGSWNFGPNLEKKVTVLKLLRLVFKNLDINKKIIVKKNKQMKETLILRLNCSKAKKQLNWKRLWNTSISIKKTSNWYKAYLEKKNFLKVTNNQINDYFKDGI